MCRTRASARAPVAPRGDDEPTGMSVGDIARAAVIPARAAAEKEEAAAHVRPLGGGGAPRSCAANGRRPSPAAIGGHAAAGITGAVSVGDAPHAPDVNALASVASHEKTSTRANRLCPAAAGAVGGSVHAGGVASAPPASTAARNECAASSKARSLRVDSRARGENAAPCGVAQKSMRRKTTWRAGEKGTPPSPGTGTRASRDTAM